MGRKGVFFRNFLCFLKDAWIFKGLILLVTRKRRRQHRQVEVVRKERNTPLKSIMEPEIFRPWQRRFLLGTIIFRFHVKLWACRDLG